MLLAAGAALSGGRGDGWLRATDTLRSLPTGPQDHLRAAPPRSGERYIAVVNMMCALGVPGYMSHGALSDGTAESPVDFSVANGMYVT